MAAQLDAGMIAVRNLSYTYRNRPAPTLRDINVNFGAGQLALIAGASGSGKTTLARCINGLIPRNYPNGALIGHVEIDGADIKPLTLAELAQRVGTVLQDPEKQIVAADVMGEIAFGLENLGIARREIARRVEQAAEQLNITYLLERNTFELSGGEKQKVAVAGVLAMEPRALLMDEPLASLDPASARETMALLRGMADRGSAVMVIEHRVKAVQAARPEQVVWMEEGRVSEGGEQKAEDGGRMTAWSEQSSDLRPLSSERSPLLSLRNVRFSYDGGREVLSGIDLEICAGDRVALLGPNGAGKSTLCKHMIGLNRPAHGQVLIDGADTRALSVAQMARTVGYVFQSPSYMLFAPTLREELAFGPKNLKLAQPELERQVMRAAQAMGLSDRLADSPFSLSFGGQKRASIASVLAMGTRMLVMDEPTAGQDSATVARFMHDILKSEQLEAMLFATHDLGLARAYANRVIVMRDGAIVADGAADAVLADEALLRRSRLI
jgi:energy-coupling factor transport system ATP-binding protein